MKHRTRNVEVREKERLEKETNDKKEKKRLEKDFKEKNEREALAIASIL